MNTKPKNCNVTRSSRPALFLNTILTAGLLAMTGTAKATLNAYDPFNYTIGTQPGLAPTGTPTQTKGGGFTGAWGAGGASFTAAAGLSYPGLLSTNNSLKITVNAGYDQELLASPISSGTIYMSYLFVPGTESSGGDNGTGNIDDGVQISPGGNGIFLGITSYGATQGSFGVNKVVGYGDFNANLWQSASPNITYGTTNFIVIKLVNIGGNDWNGSIWVNPTAGTGTEPAADGTFVMNGGGAIGTAAFVNRNGPGNSLTFDELRYATTWSDAVSYTPPTPLNVSITSPANASSVGNNFAINASASIYPGTVTNVNFYDGATLLGNSTSQPYSYNASLLAGAHTLSAIAYASSNSILVTATNSISITVTDTPPLVVYEPFNYLAPGTAFPNGTAANGSGLSGNWTVVNDTIVDGLTYPNLPSTGNALRQNQASTRSFVSFASTVASGTKYFSFLLKNVGNSGGDTVGTYLIGSGSTSLYVGFNGGYSGTQTSFGLGTVNTAGGTAASASTMWSTTPVSNTGTNLIVVRIDFNTSGANDLVSLWINPPAGTNSPGVAANLTSSTHDVGVISGFGVNVTGGYAPIVDELNVGDSYASVVGGTPAVPTIATTIEISTNPIVNLNWSAQSTNNYQPQSSPDNSTWSNLGGLLFGNAVTSLFDAPPAAYYQVLEIVSGGPGANVIQNPSFETADGNSCGAANWTGSANTPNGPVLNENSQTVYATNQWSNGITTLMPTNGSVLMYMEGTTSNATPTAPNTYVQSDFSLPVNGGSQYRLQFYAANPVQVGGGNPQYHIFWANDLNVPQGDVFGSFASAGTTWKEFNFTNTAPAGATKMWVSFFQAVGAGTSWDWVTLVDDVNVYALALPGGTNYLTPTLTFGNTFTATIKTNGVTAIGVTGTVSFKTNSVSLSAASVAGGTATSANALLSPPYTVTAIYSGDSTYIGSTNTLSVSGGTSNTPIPITYGVAGNVLTMSWPSDHLGWFLQSQVTNSLSVGLSTNWVDVPGSQTSTQAVINISQTNASAFFRLRSPTP